MTGSVSFDRAASYYDETRRLPAEAHRAAIDLLAEELGGRGRCLEVGVGTGRFALDLHARGVPVAGVDLSAAMLARLVAKAGGVPPFPIVRADATGLPFGDGVFGAAFAVHVLHLVAGWERAVAEMIRIVRPGGVIVLDRAHPAFRPTCHTEVRRRLVEVAGLDSGPVGLDDDDALTEAMARAGLVARPLRVIWFRPQDPLDVVIGQFEQGLVSAAWRLDEDSRMRAGTRVRAWAAERYGDLTAPISEDALIAWSAYDVPAGR